jgi:acetyl esterase/lipase
MAESLSVCPCIYMGPSTSIIIPLIFCIGGNRRTIVPEFLQNLARNHGWAFISADYRLLIPASGNEMLEDVLSLFNYIENDLPQVDLSRIAVFGSSAGAYPARLAGIYAKPKPKAIAMIHGRELTFPYYRLACPMPSCHDQAVGISSRCRTWPIHLAAVQICCVKSHI